MGEPRRDHCQGAAGCGRLPPSPKDSHAYPEEAVPRTVRRRGTGAGPSCVPSGGVTPPAVSAAAAGPLPRPRAGAGRAMAAGLPGATSTGAAATRRGRSLRGVAGASEAASRPANGDEAAAPATAEAERRGRAERRRTPVASALPSAVAAAATDAGSVSGAGSATRRPPRRRTGAAAVEPASVTGGARAAFTAASAGAGAGASVPSGARGRPRRPSGCRWPSGAKEPRDAI